MRRLLLPLLLTALLLAGLLPASATTEDAVPLSLRIEQIDAQADGSTRMTLSVSGLPAGETLDLSALEIVENGQPVPEIQLASSEQVGDTAVVPAVAIAFDVSGSTQGPPIQAARAAAVDLLRAVGDNGALVAVVSFGETTETITPLTSDVGAAVQGVQGLTAAGGTAVFDGVSRAARILAEHDGPRDVVLFSDGEDTTSGSSLDDVRAIVADTGTRVTSVALETDGQDIASLQAIADASGGSLVQVGQVDGLASAFERIAADLTNRVEIAWTVPPQTAPPSELNIVATYRTASGAASDGTQLTSPRLAEVTPPREVEAPVVPVPFLANNTGLIVGIGAVALAVLLLLFLILATTGERRRSSRLDRRMAAYEGGSRQGKREAAAEPGRSLTDRASTAFESLPRPTTVDERLAANIEHADWPMRVGEFLLLSLAIAVLGGVVGVVLVSSIPIALLLFLVGLVGPFAVLTVAVSRRRAAFNEQLPTLLQVLSGALRAGHAFSTALDGAVNEVDDPAKSELRRASVEARLGRPMDKALLGVADRMESEDLRWVIGALEVQREVGGNLAEVLNNVAATLRDRSSVQRQVKALSAEGRLSASVISFLPFGLFVVLAVINPGYTTVLFTDPRGRLLLLAGAVLLGLGIVWLRKLVQPKY